MNVLLWILVGFLAWLLLAVAISLFAGAVVRNRDRK